VAGKPVYNRVRSSAAAPSVASTVTSQQGQKAQTWRSGYILHHLDGKPDSEIFLTAAHELGVEHATRS